MITRDNKKADYDYIIKIIQYLETRHKIFFFITTKDFDLLFRWWEKRIPLKIIEDSISIVAARWKDRKKRIASFSSFYYEVKKNFKAFLELNVGAEVMEEKEDEYGQIENFFTNYPEELAGLKEEFANIYRKLQAKEDFELDAIYEKLLTLFKNDDELGIKVEVFIKHLAPRLRSPEIKEKYRLNYLLNKFNIPDFDLYKE
jgi:hypothetical protein